MTIWRPLRFLLPFLEQFPAKAQLFSNLAGVIAAMGCKVRLLTGDQQLAANNLLHRC